jgi:hypothetical protein
MKAPKHSRTAAALCVALALQVPAGLVVAGQADAASSQGSKPKSSRAPDTVTLRPRLEYPNPQYPNHKPLRGDYPGSYGPTSSTAPTPASGFDWPAAGAGAAGMLGLILLLAAATSAMRIARNRSHRMRLSRTGR